MRTIHFPPSPKSRLFAFIFSCLLASSFAATPPQTPAAQAPVHRLGADGLAVSHWVVLGPLPNPKNPRTDEPLVPFIGLNTDFLSILGGESKAALTPATQIPYAAEGGTTRTLSASSLAAKPSGIVDFNAHFSQCKPGVAYAFAWIESPAAQEVQCFLGSGDGVKLWLNGSPLQTKPSCVFEQSCIPRQLQFKAALRPGRNSLLAKVDNGSGDWALILELARPAEAAKIQATLDRAKVLKEFQDAALWGDCPGKLIFSTGAFPRVVWEKPALAEKAWGRALPLRVRWFDTDLNEVTTAVAPGRYAAYVEATLPDGRLLRRAQTFFCAAPGDSILTAEITTATLRTPTRLVDQAIWATRAEDRQRITNARFWGGMGGVRDSTLLLAALAGRRLSSAPPSPLDDPAMVDMDFHYRLKAKLIGPSPFPALAPPRRRTQPAPVLRAGSEREAGMRLGTAARLAAIGHAWSTNGGETFTACVARRGVIFFHESFPAPGKPPVSLRSRFNLDSLTKLLTSLFFQQFLDQGLVRLDDPVVRYLPDLAAPGATSITLRQCLMHTSGLEGHAAWYGMANPWLENVIANAGETLRPGEIASYNGMGFDLAAKVMERIGGRPYFRLLHERFLDPLGITQAPMTDCAMSAQLTAEELARLGQVLLGRGRYGELEFFSPATFAGMLPRPAAEAFPKLPKSDWEYGLGLSWMRQPDPPANKAAAGEERFILGKNIIGHGALSSTVLRVDLDHDLVIAIPRAGGGSDFDHYLSEIMRALEDGLE